MRKKKTYQIKKGIIKNELINNNKKLNNKYLAPNLKYNIIELCHSHLSLIIIYLLTKHKLGTDNHLLWKPL